MESKNERDLRCLQLQFVGKILAGFTHEIKNHLAIVKESVGLMGDMMKMEKSGKDKAGQYLEIIRSIEEQIERSILHFSYLNRFAHRMDLPLTKINVNECLEELLALLHRFANQRRISFGKEFQKDLSAIHSNPSMLQLLVFNFVEENLTKLDKNSVILIKTQAVNGSIAVSIIPKGNILGMEAEKIHHSQEINDYVIRLLGVNISKKTDTGEVVITIPAASS